MEIKKIQKNAIIAAIYVTLTLINPLGWGMIQFRISESIAILPFYKREYIPGLLIGVALANAFSPLGMVDVVFGLGCGIVAYSISKYIKNIFANTLIFALVCGVGIGMELNYVLGLPFIHSFTSIVMSTLLTSTLGIALIEKTQIKKYL